MKLSDDAIKKLRNKIDLPVGEKESLAFTTFKLSAEAHDDIKNLAELRGLTLTAVFDSLVSLIYEVEADKTLDFSKFATKKNEKLIRKTYALNKDTVKRLTQFAKGEKLSRDLLIDSMARILKMLIDDESKENQKKYPEVLKLIQTLWSDAEDIENKVVDLLGHDDPARKRLSLIVTQLMSLVQDVDRSIMEGTSLDHY